MVLTVNQETFKRDVLGASVPVVVSFWAPWCGICRLVTPMLSALQETWGGPIQVVSINADENLHLASMYRLTTLPTVMVFDQGDVLCRLDRFHNRDDLRSAAVDLKQALSLARSQLSVSA